MTTRTARVAATLAMATCLVAPAACQVGARPAAGMPHAGLSASGRPVPAGAGSRARARGGAAPALPAVQARPDGTSGTPAPPTVDVQGRAVTWTESMTVAQALGAAGVAPHAGLLVSAEAHRPIRPDGHPAVLLVNDVPVTPAAAVGPGDDVRVVAGTDQVEPTSTQRRPIPSDPTGANLYVGGRPGVREVVTGAISGEVVSTRVVRPAVIGRLRSPGLVLLTFDDGPDPQNTPALLRLLAAHHVHAVFCMIGREAQSHPDLVRQVVAHGHVLCDHTQDHDEHLATRDPVTVRGDIARAASSITAASGGVRPTYFRAPGGNWSPALEAEARRQHMAPLKWTVDPRDWARPGAPEIVRTVLATLRPGGVILMHDGGGDRRQTIQALTVLLEKLPKLGYRFATP